MAHLDFFYDLGSPYSYLASTRVEAIAADCGATLSWRPFLLGGVYKATGNQMPASNPHKARYMLQDLARWSAYYRVPLVFNPGFPPNTLLAMRVLTAAQGDQRVLLTHQLYRAFWVDGEDLSAECLARHVPDALLQRASDPDVKDALRATTDEAVQRGAFGAPTFVVGDQLFWGNDRLPFVEQSLRGQA